MWLNAGLQRIRAPNPVFIRCYITFMTMIGSGFTKQGRTPHLFGTERCVAFLKSGNCLPPSYS